MSQITKPAQMIQKLFGRVFQMEEEITGRKRPQFHEGISYIPPQQSFEKALRELAREQELVVAGNLHVLNTAKIKEKVGPKWDRLKTIVQMNIEKIIEEHLGPKDKMLHHGELNYVIVFSDMDEEDASKQVLKISRQVVKQIFGTDALLEGFELESTAAAVDATQLQDEEASLGKLLAALDEIGEPVLHSTQSFKENEHKGKSQQPRVSEDRMMAKISAILDKMAASLSQLNEAQDLESLERILKRLQSHLTDTFFVSETMLEEISSARSSDAKTLQMAEFLNNLNQMSAQLNSELHEMHEGMSKAADQKEKTPAAGQSERLVATADLLEQARAVTSSPENGEILHSHADLLAEFGEDASFKYYPIWDVKLNVVNTYRCAISLTVDGKTRELSTMLPSNCPQHMHERLNLITAQKALLDIKQAVETEIVCAFGITLRHSLLQNARTRTALGSMLRTLSYAEKQLLVIELTDIADNTWASLILENVAFLKPFCRALLVRLPKQFKEHTDLKVGGVYAVGYHLSHLSGSEASKFQELDRLVIAAERVGLITYVSGVDHPSLAASAVGSGVRYIGGTAVGAPLDFPWGILPFKLGSIYSRHMSG